ncbi:hypothetical protein J6590_091376 [Homalodisca vitripennis]|nr:hypothetical protein J6590_091376 [Homalodisca vitripennis]
MVLDRSAFITNQVGDRPPFEFPGRRITGYIPQSCYIGIGKRCVVQFLPVKAGKRQLSPMFMLHSSVLLTSTDIFRSRLFKVNNVILLDVRDISQTHLSVIETVTMMYRIVSLIPDTLTVTECHRYLRLGRQDLKRGILS